jgi:hypothetical protein
MSNTKFILTILVFASLVVFQNCSSEKESTKLNKSDISPGTAEIVGTITEIEPISSNSEMAGPCSKAPCIALVKVSSARYGAAFPPLVMGKEIRIKFRFTLEKTTKELFPNMEEEYPGLKVGDEFTAIVSTIVSVDDTAPKFQINGYELN